MFKPKPGLVIAMLGFCGLTFSLIDNSGEIGSKIPIVLFFIVVLIFGLIVQMVPQETTDDTYGEVGGKREFS